MRPNLAINITVPRYRVGGVGGGDAVRRQIRDGAVFMLTIESDEMSFSRLMIRSQAEWIRDALNDILSDPDAR